MLERKKILVNKTEFKGITAGISSVIQLQHYNDKHDDSFDQNIDKVVDLYLKISVVSDQNYQRSQLNIE